MFPIWTGRVVVDVTMHSRPENLKKFRPKKNLWIQINQFHENFFDQIPFFCNFKMAKNQFLNRKKSLKLPKMQFHEKKFDLIDFTSFLPVLFIFWQWQGYFWNGRTHKSYLYTDLQRCKLYNLKTFSIQYVNSFQNIILRNLQLACRKKNN